jgi:hypothetical protein
MNSNEFRSKLALIGLKQAQFAIIINVSANTVSSTLKRDNVPVLWQLAIESLLHYSSEQIDQLLGVN